MNGASEPIVKPKAVPVGPLVFLTGHESPRFEGPQP